MHRSSQIPKLISQASVKVAMKIGIVGGTGGMGEGFAMRWCVRHDVIVGSREAQKAKEAAANYMNAARQAYGPNAVIAGSITGDDNISLAKDSDVLILSIPYEFIEDTCSKLAPQVRPDCIIVSPIVPMTRTDSGFVYIPLLEQGKKTAGEWVADKMAPRSRVVSAFHTISEMKLKNVNLSLDSDTFVCGDDPDVVAKLSELASEVTGLRPVYLGPLSLTYQAEVLTPMLLNAAKRNKMKNPGVRLT
ncbi:putative NADPH-dependent F420 reductase [Nitrososphaera viennensis EN76]|nr:putative NADPH-dependent F420 reductase [Nitrososphaera viennensis EN76]